MKPAPFEYDAPDTVDEALDLLAEHGDDAKVLAGGQSLIPLMALRLARPARLVDVGRIVALQTIDANGSLVVGAGVRRARRRTRPRSGATLPAPRPGPPTDRAHPDSHEGNDRRQRRARGPGRRAPRGHAPDRGAARRRAAGGPASVSSPRPTSSRVSSRRRSSPTSSSWSSASRPGRAARAPRSTS